jgi:regulator of extracellular matrix RemA (YlzA/DUF370 family)
MDGELVHIGFGNILVMDKVVAIASPGSAPIKRAVQDAKANGKLIDMTSGRRTKAVIFTRAAILYWLLWLRKPLPGDCR